MTSCGTTDHCATFGTVAQSVCEPSCSASAECPTLPLNATTNSAAACNFGLCALLCNNRACPTGMVCSPNVTYIDTQTGAMSMIDVCVIAP
jgi:hypothetical protein